MLKKNPFLKISSVSLLFNVICTTDVFFYVPHKSQDIQCILIVVDLIEIASLLPER